MKIMVLSSSKLRQKKHPGKTKKAPAGKAATSSKTPRAPFSFKRQVLPPLVGLLVMTGVLGLFNGQYLIAQYHYYFGQKSSAESSQNTGTAVRANGNRTDGGMGNTTVAPHPERGPYLTVPSIGVEAPVVFEPSVTEWKVQVALRSGVVHYGDTAKPGQRGNAVIIGHSSGQPWAPGDYKFVFTLLNKLQKDQLVLVDYQGVRYTYKVTERFVVTPTDISVLAASNKPMLTLITCTPVGTSKNRLVVHAELVSPLPTDDGRNATTQSATLPQRLPSN